MQRRRITKQERIRQVRLMKTALVCCVLLIILIAVILTISGKGRRSSSSAEKTTASSAAVLNETPVEKETQSVSENSKEEETAPDVLQNSQSFGGWTTIDGLTYHLNESGQPDLGWHLIDGKSCYFDNSGVYCPDESNENLIAFTFDDGPSHEMEEILELCIDTGARVTFFMIGAQVETGGGVIPFLVKYRCGIGNHSYSHTDNAGRPAEETAADFARCNDWIAYYNNGVGADLIRFPYGNHSQEQLEAAAMPAIFWNIDSQDWDLQNVEQICQRIRSMVTDGSIILMHDRIPETVEACRILFPELIGQGYRLVTVSELAAAKGVELQPGTAYYDFCGY